MIWTPYVLCLAPCASFAKHKLKSLFFSVSSPSVCASFSLILFPNLGWGAIWRKKGAHKTGNRTYILCAQSCCNVTRKKQRKNSCLARLSLMFLNKFEIWIFPPSPNRWDGIMSPRSQLNSAHYNLTRNWVEVVSYWALFWRALSCSPLRGQGGWDLRQFFENNLNEHQLKYKKDQFYTRT